MANQNEDFDVEVLTPAERLEQLQQKMKTDSQRRINELSKQKKGSK